MKATINKNKQDLTVPMIDAKLINPDIQLNLESPMATYVLHLLDFISKYSVF